MFYMNKEWVAGKYDCWSLVREFYKKELNINLNAIVIPTNQDGSYDMKSLVKEFKTSNCYEHFVYIDMPINYCVALMAASIKKETPIHVGIHIDGRILHNEMGSNVAYETISSISDRWTIKGYYQWLN